MQSVRYGHKIFLAILIILVGIFPLVELLTSSVSINFITSLGLDMGNLKFLLVTDLVFDGDDTWMVTVFN